MAVALGVIVYARWRDKFQASKHATRGVSTQGDTRSEAGWKQPFQSSERAERDGSNRGDSLSGVEGSVSIVGTRRAA